MKKIMWMLTAVLAIGACGAAEFKPSDDGFIKNWLLLEPIQLSDKAATHDEDNQKDFFDKEQYAGQKAAKPKEGDVVKVGTTDRTWKAVQAEDYFLALPEQTNSMSIAVAYIECADEITGVTLKIGSDDSSVWYLNGKEVIRAYSGRAVDKDQNSSEPLTLNKGQNVLMAQVINGEGQSGLCARFSHIVKNFTVTTQAK